MILWCVTRLWRPHVSSTNMTLTWVDITYIQGPDTTRFNIIKAIYLILVLRPVNLKKYSLISNMILNVKIGGQSKSHKKTLSFHEVLCSKFICISMKSISLDTYLFLMF